MKIEIRGLAKTYPKGVQALKDVDLTIPSGMFGLLGPTGAGKTTLMRILAGIVRPSAGQARVGPHDLATGEGRLAVKRMLGYLPQELGVYPDLSAAEFVDYVAILKGLSDPAARRARVGELLEMVGLAEVAGRKLKAFSGGMKRRVGLLGGGLPPACSNLSITAAEAWANIALLLGVAMAVLMAAQIFVNWRMARQ